MNPAATAFFSHASARSASASASWAPAGDGSADPGAPAAFADYLSGVLGLPLPQTGRAA